MKCIKRIVSMIISATLVVTMLPLTGTTVMAAETDTFSHVDSVSEVEYLTTVEDAGKILREAMVNRIDKIPVYFRIMKSEFTQDKIRELSSNIYNEAIKHTGNPKEGDSLSFANGGYHVSAAAKGAGEYYLVTMTFDMDFYATKEQEQKLDVAIANLLEKLNLDEMSDYEKICAIHDYMAENISYDHIGRGDKNNKLCHTAYAALINGTSVCQGYATLMYRLALEAGIDCRIISGESLGDHHAWNIVKLGSKYYNLDVTWDSSTHTYQYFLKGTNDLKDHKADDTYIKPAFTKLYPIAKTGYKSTCTKHDFIKHVTAADMKYDGKIETICKKCHKVSSKKVIHRIDKVKLSYTKAVYTGKTKIPKVTVKDSFGETISSKYYTVKKPIGRKSVGTYTYKITFKGHYQGTKSLTLTIRPPVVKMKAPTGRKSSFTARWDMTTAPTEFSGYQLQYSTDKNFVKGCKTIKIANAKTVSKKVTKVKAKTQYYLRIRAYKVVGKTTYYSSWSAKWRTKTK